MQQYKEVNDKKIDRQRKKRFYNSIRQQIEFYLGDVNLSKDRFFRDLLSQNPYVDVDVILKCNKIKKLTTNAKDIKKALKESELLSVTEDGMKIFRTVPVAPITNADECTIYVEDLPLEVDHEWLTSVFSKYGKIAYVSIPHYKTTKKIKGFAFVQFENPDSASRALDAFRSVNSCLSSSMQPGKLKSVQTFEGEKDIVLPPQVTQSDEIKSFESRRESNCDENALHDDKPLEQTVVQQSSPKQEQEGDEEPKKKRRKKEMNADQVENNVKIIAEEINNTEDNVSIKKKKKITNSEKHSITESEREMCEEDETADKNDGFVENKSSCKRKRKKAKKEPVQTYGMQILSKRDWKRLRNKYLEEQRKRMHELKQQLRRTYLSQNERIPPENVEMETNDGDAEKCTSDCRIKFTPGVIIKLEVDEPIKSVKYFKTEVKRYANVEYIDANENSTVAYFRCANNEIANQVIGLNRWPYMTILEGDEEQAYWEKIKNDRKEKFEQKIRCCNNGKKKLMKKMEAAMTSHIRFSE